MAQTTLNEEREPLIDPEVRAYIFSLVSALGGSSGENDGRYVLGDDSLAVLKDIKRWLRLYDDKTNRLDVARLLAEANLVNGDLLPILATWPEDAPEGSFRSKVALFSVDLLTQLTWPIEKTDAELSSNHLLHIPYLQAAQTSYKRAVLQRDGADFLRRAVRVALPSIASPRSERSPLQENIIKVVLFLFRNIAMIGRPPSAPVEDDDMDISRSTTVDAFHRQDIFSVILAIGSGLADEFDTHDVELLDILYHLLKGIDPDKLFMDKDEILSANTRELQVLIAKEKSMLSSYSRNAPSRHSRFTPMMWVKRPGEKSSILMGQSAFADERSTMQELDKKKKWKKPRRGLKSSAAASLDGDYQEITLTTAARRHLRSFIGDFLDSSFNPLFFSVRKAIEREATRVLSQHTRQYFYLISWFLKAESARRRKASSERAMASSQKDPAKVESFSLVAAVLNQETFVLLSRHMQSTQDVKEWAELTACMKCFSQILLTVQEMSESSLDEDQEIAENILSRIFYEESTHDRIIALLRTYNDQDFGFLDSLTDLAHVFLRLIERYSKVNVDLQVRRMRRVRKKKQQLEQPNTEYNPNEDAVAKQRDVQEAERISTERKFDFKRFAARFINQQSVNTFFALLRYYKDLDEQQLKRAHRFFYRVAFKMEMSVYLLRMDIILLLNNMIKGSETIGTDKGIRKEWEELTRQIFRLLVKKLQTTPAFAVELLFSKMSSTVFYLEYGYDKQMPKRTYKAAVELEVKPGMEHTEQIGVAVSALVNQGKASLLAWVKRILSTAADERTAWMHEKEARALLEQPTQKPAITAGANGDLEYSASAPVQDEPLQSVEDSSAPQDRAPEISVIPENDEQKTAMAKDKHLRLLFKLLSFIDGAQSISESESLDDLVKWTVPSNVTASTLSSDLELINRFEFELPSYEDGKTAEDFLRRKAAPKVRQPTSRDDGLSTDGEVDDDEVPQFEPGGATIRPDDWERDAGTKKKRLKRKRDDADEGNLAERRNARRLKELEKQRKIKSQLFVSRSDDESDEDRDKEFFAEEAKRREKARVGVMAALKEAAQEGMSGKAKGGNRRAVDEDGGSSHDEGSQASIATRERRRQVSASRYSSSDLDNTEMEVDSSGDESIAQRRRRGPLPGNKYRSLVGSHDSEADTDTSTPPSSERPSSQHKVTGIAAMLGDDATGQESDKENAGVTTAFNPAGIMSKHRTRAGFVIDSDSDD